MKTELRNVGAEMQVKILKAELTESEVEQTWRMKPKTEVKIAVE